MALVEIASQINRGADTKEIDANRLRWSGHVLRSIDHRHISSVF